MGWYRSSDSQLGGVIILAMAKITKTIILKLYFESDKGYKNLIVYVKNSGIV